MVKYVGSGGFSSVYSALWMEGPRWIWDDDAQEWTRSGPMHNVLIIHHFAIEKGPFFEMGAINKMK